MDNNGTHDESANKRVDVTLPCAEGKECPYEYDKNPDRDIEGMPFVDGDPRSCPTYGHICPEFMEDFGLTEDDLAERAIIHCDTVMNNLRRNKNK